MEEDNLLLEDHNSKLVKVSRYDCSGVWTVDGGTYV